MRYGWRLAALLVLVLTVHSLAEIASPATYRIGLKRVSQAALLYISSDQPFRLTSSENPSLFATKNAGETVAIRVNEKGVAISPDPNPVVMETLLVTALPKPGEQPATIKIGSDPNRLRAYRGSLQVKAFKDQLQVVNLLDLESYLLGVVPAEMPAHFHLEALKAQAVAARTYALRSLGRHTKEGYDLCDGVHCHAYLGANAEHPRVTQALTETRGLVVAFNGALVDSVYHADCGGATAGSTETGFGRALPYLIGGPDGAADANFCAINPRHEWTFPLPKTEVQRLLASRKLEVGDLLELKVTEAGPSGRVQKIEAVGATGTATVNGVTVRNFFGLDKVRSTRFQIAPTADGWQITGRGHGHGVGMCQFGAQGRALAGQTFDRILANYYAGSTVDRLVATGRGDRFTLASRGKSKKSPPANRPTSPKPKR